MIEVGYCSRSVSEDDVCEDAKYSKRGTMNDAQLNSVDARPPCAARHFEVRRELACSIYGWLYTKQRRPQRHWR